MLKRIILVSFFTFLIPFSYFTQSNEWIWKRGGNPNGSSSFGTIGIPSESNNPPWRTRAAEWTDKEGNFWFFGGRFNTLPMLYLNDLWKYNPVTNQFTWMGQINAVNRPGVYGTKSIASPNNWPGAREGAVSWTDSDGNFWLFGGIGFNSSPSQTIYLNDLWKYDVASGMWTWYSGASTGTDINYGRYGVKNEVNPSNNPKGRKSDDCSWVDNNGDLWLFGGMSKDPNMFLGYGTMNDLWKYSTSSNIWTWVSGDSICNQGSHGIKGVPYSDESHNITSRIAFSCWAGDNDKFYIFGGTQTVVDGINDTWEFDPAAGSWTWLHGKNTSSYPGGDWGKKCVPSDNNVPSARVGSDAHWKDNCGNLLMYGGGLNVYKIDTVRDENGNIISYTNDVSHMGDLWRYSPIKNQWTWIQGSKYILPPVVYGTKNIASPNNSPGSRMYPSSWKNDTGYWMFGGMTGKDSDPADGRKNDMWLYIPPKPIADFSNDSVVCAPATVHFQDLSDPNCDEIKSYAWDFGDPASGSNNFSTNMYPSHLYNSNGWYDVTLIVVNCMGNKDTVIKRINVGSVVETGPDENICENDSVTITALVKGSTAVSWSPTSGLSNPFIISPKASPSATTVYKITSTNGSCSWEDSLIVFVQERPELNIGNDTVLCIEDTIVLRAANYDSYIWSTESTDDSLVILKPGIYYIEAKKGFCTTTDSIIIDESYCKPTLYVPNSFTPNGDGKNDQFMPIIDLVKRYDLWVYNRWGVELFHSSNLNKGWDGKYNGYLCKEDVYLWQVKYVDINGEPGDYLGRINLIW